MLQNTVRACVRVERSTTVRTSPSKERVFVNAQLNTYSWG